MFDEPVAVSLDITFISIVNHKCQSFGKRQCAFKAVLEYTVAIPVNKYKTFIIFNDGLSIGKGADHTQLWLKMPIAFPGDISPFIVFHDTSQSFLEWLCIPIC